VHDTAANMTATIIVDAAITKLEALDAISGAVKSPVQGSGTRRPFVALPFGGRVEVRRGRIPTRRAGPARPLGFDHGLAGPPFARLRPGRACAQTARVTRMQPQRVVQPLSFRPADLDSAPAVVDLVTSAYRGEASKQGWTSEADLISGQRIDLAVLTADIRRPHSVVLLAERGDTLVGCAHVARSDETHAYFGMFAVRPTAQDRGDGKQILAEAERYAAAEWATSVMMMLVLDARTELLAFYERRGYRRTGTYQPFPYGDLRFGLPVRDDLRLEILTKTLEHVPHADTGRPARSVAGAPTAHAAGACRRGYGM